MVVVGTAIEVVVATAAIYRVVAGVSERLIVAVPS